MNDQLLTLVSESTIGTDEQGNVIKDYSRNFVFCEELSINQTEFYQAHANGLKPEIKLKIEDYYDYHDEKIAIYKGIKYNVLRAYRVPNSRSIEITLHGGVIDNGSS